jgi:hypothetical protein
MYTYYDLPVEVILQIGFISPSTWRVLVQIDKRLTTSIY